MIMRNLCVRAVLALLFFCVSFGVARSAWASAPAASWTIESFAEPTNFSQSGNALCLEELFGPTFVECDGYVVTARNAGGAATDGSSVTLKDILPEHLKVQKVDFFISSVREETLNEAAEMCTEAPPVIECNFPGTSEVSPILEPDASMKMIVYATVDSSAPPMLRNEASVSGGGAPEATTHESNPVSSSSPSFGLSSFALSVNGPDGAPDTQAGGHPYELTTVIGLNNAFRVVGPQGDNIKQSTSVQDLKDVVSDLPVGFVGSTLAAPECEVSRLAGEGRCPADTIVGHIQTEPSSNASVYSPIYNLVPERGVPAEFGFVDNLHGAHVFYTRVVPSAHGYMLQTMNSDIPAVDITHVAVTFYGDPVAKQEELARQEGRTPSPLLPVPFFTNPSSCSGETLVATIYMDSWQNPGTYNADGTPNFSDGKWVSATSESPPVTGCDLLRFPAELRAQPTTHEADKPSGLEFELKVPQSESIGVVGTPTLKKIVTTLPEGMTVDPSSGDGLAACSEAQIGWLGGSHLNFSPDAPQCPEASKIGSLELETPLVPHKFEGEMFLARQNENPFGATLAAYVVVHDPATGVLIKIPGEFLADPHTGRLTAVFDENPNLPFSDLKLHFFGGPRAELATPESCGTFTTSTELFPYSFPDSGPPTLASDAFTIDEACPSGFAPRFTALSANVEAGAYTPLVASFSRSDTDQEFAGLTATLPPGLLAKVAGVPLCSEAQIHEAEAGSGGCPESSRVGSSEAGSGPGPNPLFVPGKVYLTGPYKGGPYGLAVVTPAIAGPFNFGTIVVRQSLRIDPRTARITDVSDPFPTIIDGIPLRLRRVDVTIDRPEFGFNPTSCAKKEFTGTITGSPLGAPRNLVGTVGYATEAGASASVSAPFQVTDCAALGFAPKFSISTKAHPSRASGANLSVKMTYPKAPWGSQTNLERVKVSLPKQLPSRLTTLQKACTAAQFKANPAGCPAASVVGHAVLHTPILPAPLEGPVYFVSNGGEAFPNLIMVLQGNNVTIELVGNTFISKKGITSSTFKALPDAPFTSFELVLPQGRYSALASNLPARARGSFCRQKLSVPVEFVAQSGKSIKKTVKAGVSGCPKAKRSSRKPRQKHTTGKSSNGHAKGGARRGA
jgi:hypothetical protein